MSRTEIVSEVPLDPETALAIERLFRTAMAGVKHRLVCEFTIVDGQLGVETSLERKVFRKWVAVRPSSWVGLVPATSLMLYLLLHLAEHGRFPQPFAQQPESPK